MPNTLLVRALRVLVLIAVPTGVVAVCWGQGTRDRAETERPAAMYVAALNGDVQQVKSLLGDPRVIRVDEHGITPLALAAFGGQPQVVSLLISHDGAAMRQVDERGRTPLHWAAIGGHADVVEQLIRQGANVNATDRDGEAPLHLAARFGKPEAFALLLAHGADLAAKGTDGCTPIDVAREAEDEDMREMGVVAELESQIDE